MLNHTYSRTAKPKLLDRVRIEIRTRRYSLRTEEAYVQWIRRFILFHGKRHPAEMAESEINKFLNHLAIGKNVAASTQNQALCAILFLYRQVLKKSVGELDLVWAKKSKRVPVVLTPEEVVAILQGECKEQNSYWCGFYMERVCGILNVCGYGLKTWILNTTK